jgi:hypothetical protein
VFALSLHAICTLCDEDSLLAIACDGEDYQRGLRLAQAACRLEPRNAWFRTTLGVPQYRCGLVAESLATLTQSIDLKELNECTDLAFLVLAQHRLGQSDGTRHILRRLREARSSVLDATAKSWLWEMILDRL